MIRMSTEVCYGGIHKLLMYFAFIGIMLFYPLQTFLFPDLQYADKTLDLKFKTSYIIFQIQVKLIIIGLSSFFLGFQD